jgi:hypothetical protein
LFGVAASYFIMHDTLTPAFGAAALLVIAGLYLVNKPDLVKKPDLVGAKAIVPNPNVPAQPVSIGSDASLAHSPIDPS